MPTASTVQPCSSRSLVHSFRNVVESSATRKLRPAMLLGPWSLALSDWDLGPVSLLAFSALENSTVNQNSVPSP